MKTRSASKISPQVYARIAGAGYLVNSAALILASAYAEMVAPVLALLGELSFSLWLIVKGVNVERWNRRALTTA